MNIFQIFRDMAKKQKVEMKYTYRIQLRHKNLEARLDELQKFRKQHEQLSNVIARLALFYADFWTALNIYGN